MVNAKQFLPRLQFFAESFTGYPVKILISSEIESQDELTQVQDSLKIYVPREVNVNNEEIGFNYFKGVVTLQSSSALYNGIPKEKENFDIIKLGRVRNLDDFVIEGEGGGLIPLSYQIIELSRRMQCIAKDYRVLSEDMVTGFQNIFDPRLLRKSERKQSMGKQNTNEIDLALTSTYWKSLGIDSKKIQQICDSIPRDYQIGFLREEITNILERLVFFNDPLKSSYKDSLDRASDFARYMYDLSGDLGIGSFLQLRTPRDYFSTRLESLKTAGTKYEEDPEDINRNLIRNIELREKKLESLLEEDSRLKLGLYSKENIKHRLSVLKERKEQLMCSNGTKISGIERERYFGSSKYTSSDGAALSLRTVFQEVPRSHLVRLEIPEKLQKQEKELIVYLPELRDRVLVPRAVKVSVYDLTKGQSPSEQQTQYQLSLKNQISKLEEEIAKHNKKIHSDINYIYENLQEILKKRNQSEKKAINLRKQLTKSKEIYNQLARRKIETNAGLTRRIEREMEAIKPAARLMVRNCFEGELDEKKFYEWWLDAKIGIDSLPNFYYQWQKRRRDVASVLLIDASQSIERLATDNKTFLDLLKEAAYYFVLGSQFLEDNSAVLAYNGKGEKNLRIFMLKDFLENPRILKDRLELLRGELNNRDGSAIRYATQYLSNFPAKTKFLFHLGDMQPSDLEFESSSPAILFHRYEGEGALEDVTHAFDSVRAHGIMPIGICFKSENKEKDIENSKKQDKAIGKFNLAVLKKLKTQKQAILDTNLNIEERLKRNFKRNYKIIDNPSELPKILRDVYIKTSFD